MIKFKIVKLQYESYLRILRPESKKFNGQIYIFFLNYHLSDEKGRVEYTEAVFESILSN